MEQKKSLEDAEKNVGPVIAIGTAFKLVAFGILSAVQAAIEKSFNLSQRRGKGFEVLVGLMVIFIGLYRYVETQIKEELIKSNENHFLYTRLLTGCKA